MAAGCEERLEKDVDRWMKQQKEDWKVVNGDKAHIGPWI